MKLVIYLLYDKQVLVAWLVADHLLLRDFVPYEITFIIVCLLISIYSSFLTSNAGLLQYTDQEMIPARNARNVVTLEEVMFVTIQRENILPSNITDY
jgi:hypothetical protein